MMIHVPPIRAGATLGLIAPASPPPDPNAIPEIMHYFSELGFNVVPGKSVGLRHGFLAGDDDHRLADLVEMFRNPSIDGIMCLRGGYGTLRILHRLDFRLLARHPKFILGFSDATALLSAISQRTMMVTFHGPTPHSLVRDSMSLYTIEHLLKSFDPRGRIRSVLDGYSGGTVEIVRGGRVRAPLWGGNLTMVASLLGTPWQPDFGGKIFFFEEVGEAPYRIDRLLTQLLQSGALKGVKGIAVGVLRNCQDPLAERVNEYRQTAHDVIRERLADLRVPFVMGLPFGHGPDNTTIPYGAWGLLDGERGDLVIEESGVGGTR